MYQPDMNIQKILQNGNHPHVPVMKVKKLSVNAILPSRATPQSAGYDLFSAVNVIVPARQTVLVPTDLIIAVPNKTYGRIGTRTGSGLAAGHSIDVGCVVIEPGDRNPVQVILINNSDVNVHVYLGDKIAQIILVKVLMADVDEVSNFV